MRLIQYVRMVVVPAVSPAFPGATKQLQSSLRVAGASRPPAILLTMACGAR